MSVVLFGWLAMSMSLAGEKGPKRESVSTQPTPGTLADIRLASAPAEIGVSREIWVGLRTDNSPGDGTLASPFNGTGGGFDAKLREFYLNGVTNLVVHILPGTYETQGAIAYFPRSGWRLIGAGMDVTVLKLVNVSNNVFAVVGNPEAEANIEVADLTVDCNYSSTNRNLASGVALFGTRHTIRRVRVIHAYGVFDLHENFTLSIFSAGQPSVDNLIEYCEVSEFLGNYATAISFAGGSFLPNTGRGNYARGIIRGNRVYNLHSSLGAPRAHAYGVASDGVIFEDNYAIGCDAAINNDTGEFRNWVIRGNHFLGCRFVGILMPGQSMENITIDGNEIEVDATTVTAAIWISEADGVNRVKNIKIRDNTIRSVNGLASYAGGIFINVRDGRSITVSGNRIHVALRSSFIGSGFHLFDNTDFEGRPITLADGTTADLVNLPAGQRGTLLLGKGEAYLFAETTSSPVTNGLNLMAAYARARTIQPHGQPPSSANRVTLFLWPGKYFVADGALVLDAPYIDLVGVGSAASTRIESDGNTLVQLANDVSIQNVTLHCASTAPLGLGPQDKAAYFPADNLNRAVLRNVALSAENNGLGMRVGITYAGYYENVTCGPRAWGGPGHFTGAALNCAAGDYSFASGGFFGGLATNCAAGVGSFGAGGGGFHGLAKNCTAGTDSFGGSGSMIGCEVNGVVNSTVLTTGRLTDCHFGPAPGPPSNLSTLQLGPGATLQNCTILAHPAGGGFSLDAPNPVRAKVAHCRLNRGMRNVVNDIAAPFNVIDPNVD